MHTANALHLYAIIVDLGFLIFVADVLFKGCSASSLTCGRVESCPPAAALLQEAE